MRLRTRRSSILGVFWRLWEWDTQQNKLRIAATVWFPRSGANLLSVQIEKYVNFKPKPAAQTFRIQSKNSTLQTTVKVLQIPFEAFFYQRRTSFWSTIRPFQSSFNLRSYAYFLPHSGREPGLHRHLLPDLLARIHHYPGVYITNKTVLPAPHQQ